MNKHKHKIELLEKIIEKKHQASEHIPFQDYKVFYEMLQDYKLKDTEATGE
jgi:hypothetical protein